MKNTSMFHRRHEQIDRKTGLILLKGPMVWRGFTKLRTGIIIKKKKVKKSFWAY